jgi:hypothetical protein
MIEQLKTLFFHPNKDIADCALRLAQVHDALKNGELTPSEYQELIQDLERVVRVINYTNALETKLILQQSLDIIVLLASNAGKIL